MKNYILTSFISLFGFICAAQADNTRFIISNLAPVYHTATPDTEIPSEFDYTAYSYNPYQVLKGRLSIDDYITILVLQWNEEPTRFAYNHRLIKHLYTAYQHPQRPHLGTLKDLVSPIARIPAGESDGHVRSTLLGVLGRLPLNRIAHLRISNYLLHTLNLELETNNAASLHVGNFVVPQEDFTYVSINYQKPNQQSYTHIDKLPLNVGIKYLLVYFINSYLSDSNISLRDEKYQSIYDGIYRALEKYDLMATTSAQHTKLVQELLSLMKFIPLNEALLQAKLTQLRTLILGKRSLFITVDPSVVSGFLRYFNLGPIDRLFKTPGAIQVNGLNWRHACPQGSKCTLLVSDTSQARQHANQSTHPAGTLVSYSLVKALGLL